VGNCQHIGLEPCYHLLLKFDRSLMEESLSTYQNGVKEIWLEVECKCQYHPVFHEETLEPHQFDGLTTPHWHQVLVEYDYHYWTAQHSNSC
jgi:hypothetical protein